MTEQSGSPKDKDGSRKPQQNNEHWDRLVVAALGVAAGLVLLPAVLVSVVIWAVAKRLLPGPQSRLALAAISALGFLSLALTHFAGPLVYLQWWAALVFRQHEPSKAVAALGVITLGLALSGFLALYGDWLSDQISQRLHGPDDKAVIPDEESQQIAMAVAMDDPLMAPYEDTIIPMHPDGRRMSPREHPRKVPLGYAFDARAPRQARPIFTTDHALTTHMIVTGGSGSGKTTMAKSIAAALSDLGHDVAFLDHKCDTEPGGIADFMEDYSKSHVIPFQTIHTDKLRQCPNWFNSLRGLDRDEALQALESVLLVDDEFHGGAQLQLLALGVRVLYDAHQVNPGKFPEPNIYDLGYLFASGPKAWEERVMAAGKIAPSIEVAKTYAALLIDDDRSEERVQTKSIGQKLLRPYQTSVGEHILSPTEGRHEIDLLRGGMMYFGLDVRRYKPLATMISTNLLLRYLQLASYRSASPLARERALFLLVDEAWAADLSIIGDMVNTIRSANMGIIVLTQSPAQFIQKGEDWYPRIAGSTNLNLVMPENSHDNAETLSKGIGIETRIETTHHIDAEGKPIGSGTSREVEAPIVSISNITGLNTLTGVVKARDPKLRPTLIAIGRRDPTDHPHAKGPDAPSSRVPSLKRAKPNKANRPVK